MLLDARHREIAQIALAAAGRRYQVAFAGGGALQIHDVSVRVTHDVDLFVRRARNVVKASAVMAGALGQAGYRVEMVSALEELVDFVVYPPGSADPVQVQVAFVGPVVTLDYLATRKTAALLERHQVRDYIDIASLVDAGYEIAQLLDMGFTEDPSLTREDAGDAGVHLDQISDERLARELPPGKEPAWVRAAFKDWPRYPVHTD